MDRDNGQIKPRERSWDERVDNYLVTSDTSDYHAKRIDALTKGLRVILDQLRFIQVTLISLEQVMSELEEKVSKTK